MQQDAPSASRSLLLVVSHFATNPGIGSVSIVAIATSLWLARDLQLVTQITTTIVRVGAQTKLISHIMPIVLIVMANYLLKNVSLVRKQSLA